ncbi:2-hydroxyacid dehydrogenase [Microvirga pudoricolor]|uniref:2-hydroxyacid dehydrogenase n=1 Tax=Microvirga pudoricolor TaxID=2778729 RepID=UPI0019502F28|nr:D-glycerate dehydrogenase [Microvirga pudoricolor]MBM6594003.1 D-glycerate dehydrogenase [Microvirga pudoricolor]
MKKRPVVVVTRRLPDVIETRMRELFDARLNLEDKPLSREELAAVMRDVDVLVPTVTDEIDAGLIAEAGTGLKLIANFGNGVDNIDVPAAHARGITVTNTPGVLTEDTADMTMALILAVARRIPEGAGVIPGDEWAGWSPTWMLGRRITGKRLGIVGMGRIGQAVARRAKAFGLSIHYHNRRRVPQRIEDELEATYWESLDQMLARMDIVSVNCPHTPATYHLLSARRLKLLKPTALVVNTARGEIIDETALTRLIEAGAIAGAGLDVFEEEPAVSPRLVKLARQNKVVLLPHMGSATVESRIDMGEKVIVNIKAFLDGHRPPDRVLPSMV